MTDWGAIIEAILGLLAIALMIGAAAAWEEGEDRCERCGRRLRFWEVFCRNCGRER